MYGSIRNYCKTVNGAPCLAEQGGMDSGGMGFAMIIANADGSKPKAEKIIKNPHNDHAYVAVSEGMIIIHALHGPQRDDVRLYEIYNVGESLFPLKPNEPVVCEAQRFLETVSGAWTYNRHPEGNLLEAVNVAIEKAKTPNCKQAMYVEKP